MHRRAVSRQRFRGLARRLAGAGRKTEFSGKKIRPGRGPDDAAGPDERSRPAFPPDRRVDAGQKERAPATPEPIL